LLLLKVDALNVKIGYPDYTYNDTHMNGIYSEVFCIYLTIECMFRSEKCCKNFKYEMNEEDLFKNINLIDKITTKNNLQELRKKVNKDE
jgi:hypothetical protein